MHYYKKNIGDYYKKAGRLSMLEHGAYTMLIDSCYDRERFPTMDDAIDWTWARTTEEVDAVKFILNKFFVLEGELYVQSRIQDELDAYHKMGETNTRIALEREASRRLKKQGVNESSTKREQVVNKAPPNQEPRTKNQEPLKENTIVIFDFWKETFRKTDRTALKGVRETKIKARLNEGYSVDEIKQAVLNVSCSQHHIDGGYTDIELICRDQSHLDKYIAMGGAKKINAPVDQPKKEYKEVEGLW